LTMASSGRRILTGLQITTNSLSGTVGHSRHFPTAIAGVAPLNVENERQALLALSR